MDTAFFRFGSRDNNLERAFSTALIPILFSTIAFVGLLCLFAPTIAKALAYPDDSHYVIWFAFILGFDALVALPYARLRLEQRPMRFLFFRIANVTITVLIVLFFLEICPRLADRGVTWASNLYNEDRRLDYVFLANLVASALIFILMLTEFRKIKPIFDLKLWKKMVFYALPLVIVGIAGNINQSFAVPLQKYFLGSGFEENLNNAGIYAGPAKLALLLNLFIVAFNYAAEPFFFNHYEKSDAKIIYGKVAKAFTIMACFVLLGILMYMDLIQYIIGPNYREALFIVPILLFAYLFLGLYYNFSIWYKLVDKTSIGAIISILGAIITLAVSIKWLPQIGYIASAWAALCCYLFMSLAALVIGRKYYPIPYPIWSILGYIIFTAVLFYASESIGMIIGDNFSRIGLNTIFLVIFVLIVYTNEKALIKELFLGK